MVELAFSTNAYTSSPLPEAVSRIGAHGYTGVELLGDAPHAYFPTFDAAALDAVRAALDETGLAVANVNANTAMGRYDDAPPSPFFDPSLCTADDGDRAWRIDYTRDAIDLAAATGAPAVCLASGRALAGNPPPAARDRFVNSLHDILDHAVAAAVEVGIEFEPELLVESTGEALAVLDRVDRDRLGVNLDLGHAAVNGTEPTTAIRRCAGHLTGIHLEDIAGGVGGKHYHLIPGEGDLDIRAVFDALDDIGYDGFVTLELYTYSAEPDRAAERAADELSAYI